MSKKEITVVSVIYKNLNWVVWNIKLIAKLNTDFNINFVFIDNDRILKHFRNQFILKLLELLLVRVEIKLSRNTKENLKLDGSLQHASGLDLAAKMILTEFVVVLDPDCVVIIPNWMTKFFELINDNAYDLVGTPEAQSELNSFRKQNFLNYKFHSPLPFLIFGKQNIVFRYSFKPNVESNFELDTGYLLSQSFLRGELKGFLFSAKSTRNSKCEIESINKFSCTFYEKSNPKNETWCVHFGRGSNRFGKNRKNQNFGKRIIYAFMDPCQFRKAINKYIKSNFSSK